MVPLALILKLTVSTTSTKASFFLYLTSARRQLVVPVAWDVIFEDSSAAIAEETMLSVVIYVLRVSISLFCGYPKSLISGKQNNQTSREKGTAVGIPSISSYINTKLFLTDSSSTFPKYDLAMEMKR